MNIRTTYHRREGKDKAVHVSQHHIKTHIGDVEVKFQAFLISALDAVSTLDRGMRRNTHTSRKYKKIRLNSYIFSLRIFAKCILKKDQVSFFTFTNKLCYYIVNVDHLFQFLLQF